VLRTGRILIFHPEGGSCRESPALPVYSLNRSDLRDAERSGALHCEIIPVPSAESVRFARAEEEIADALDFMPLMAPCHLLTPGPPEAQTADEPGRTRHASPDARQWDTRQWMKSMDKVNG